jgi:hypothetical protein
MPYPNKTPRRIKAVLALQSNDCPTNMSFKLLAKPTTSSGASSLVKPSLKLYADMSRIEVVLVLAREGRLLRRASKRNDMRMYPKVIIAQRS